MSGSNGDPILRVRDLSVEFLVRGRTASILDRVSFDLARGETLGIIGESGCGKSMTALGLLRMVPSPPGRISGGTVEFDGEDLLSATERRIRSVRGKDIAMIFQEPMTSLNPVYSIGNQITETLRRHEQIRQADALAAAVELLRTVQIPAPERRVKEYPHQLSGGMRQRVMIAMALACNPKVLIADEPTTALDVTVQAQIFDLLKERQAASGTSIILITHDFGAVSEMADRVIVMYAGHKIEEGTLSDVRDDPRHPYTQGLLRSMPEIRLDGAEFRKPLPEIPGAVPDLTRREPGCPFAPRCAVATTQCRKMPVTTRVSATRSVKCWHAADGGAA